MGTLVVIAWIFLDFVLQVKEYLGAAARRIANRSNNDRTQ